MSILTFNVCENTFSDMNVACGKEGSSNKAASQMAASKDGYCVMRSSIRIMTDYGTIE